MIKKVTTVFITLDTPKGKITIFPFTPDEARETLSPQFVEVLKHLHPNAVIDLEPSIEKMISQEIEPAETDAEDTEEFDALKEPEPKITIIPPAPNLSDPSMHPCGLPKKIVNKIIDLHTVQKKSDKARLLADSEDIKTYKAEQYIRQYEAWKARIRGDKDEEKNNEK